MTHPICLEGLALIMHFEGLGDGDKIKPGLQPYQDHIGVWTIGYGATYMDGQRVTKDTHTITKLEAEALLDHDTLRFARAVDRMVEVPLHHLQRSALISFAFNLGSNALKQSTLLRCVNSHERWDEVPYQFTRWVYAAGRRTNGLVRRRNAEADMWEKGYLALWAEPSEQSPSLSAEPTKGEGDVLSLPHRIINRIMGIAN